MSIAAPFAADQPSAARGARTRVAVAGATGYAGQELVRLLARHPAVTLTAAMSSAATSTPRPLPALARIWEGTVAPLDVDRLAADADIVFLALPETAAAEVGGALLQRGARVIDLSGAFRIRNDADRQRWYPATGALPQGIVYGLSELHAELIRDARLVSCPGCYPTGALLSLQPLAAAGLIEGPVVVDAKSGISGAGKTPSERTHFCENHGSVAAYGVFSHRHTAEIEQELNTTVTFIPHLVPLDRGILETIYVSLRPATTEAAGERHASARVRGGPVRATDRRHAARDQARGAYELLRHRLEGRRGDAPARGGRGARQPLEGCGGPGSPEPEHRARPRRAHGIAMNRKAPLPSGAGRKSTLPRLVLKIGGELLEQPQDLEQIAQGIAALAERSALVVVHGGGREIDDALATAGIPKQQVDGLRVTDAQDARRRRRGAGGRDQHAAGRGRPGRRREAGGPDGSRRFGGDREACIADHAVWRDQRWTWGW